MKRSIINAIIIVVFFMGIIVSCDLIPGLTDKKVTELSAADAKVELEAANQKMILLKDEMLDTKGLNALMQLSSLNVDNLKSKTISTSKYFANMTRSKAMSQISNMKNLKSSIMGDDTNYGIFVYNFEKEEFDKVSESSSMIKMSYPADDLALSTKKLNAVLTIDNLEYFKVEVAPDYEGLFPEELPISAEITLKVDGATELSASYKSTFDSKGLPTSMSCSMETADYSMDMSYSGSGTKYNTKFSYKEGKTELMGYDLNVKYESDMETVNFIEGYALMNTLKFDGSVDFAKIEAYQNELNDSEDDFDLDYYNSLFSVDVIQADKNAKIGVLEYKLNDGKLEFVIVYEDGTYDWISDVMTIMDSEELGGLLSLGN